MECVSVIKCICISKEIHVILLYAIFTRQVFIIVKMLTISPTSNGRSSVNFVDKDLISFALNHNFSWL